MSCTPVQITRQSVEIALANSEFVPFYQPIVDSNGQISAVEVLMRWEESPGRFISAKHFIPALENVGLLSVVTSELLKKVAQDLSCATTTKQHLSVYINFSPRQIQKADFVYECFALLERMNLNLCSLVIEITESLPLTNLDSVKRNMQRLKLAGVKFFLDDFGCGHSNLALLQKLDVEGIKIDKRFINDVIRNPDSKIITKFIIELAHSLNLEVIAEGIESVEQMKMLTEMGAHKYQGYYVSEPLEIRQLEKLMLLS